MRTVYSGQLGKYAEVHTRVPARARGREIGKARKGNSSSLLSFANFYMKAISFTTFLLDMHV
jgi:hypothetical protein